MCYQGNEAGDFALGIGSGGMVQLLVAAASAQKALVRSLKLNPDPAWNERGPRRDETDWRLPVRVQPQRFSLQARRRDTRRCRQQTASERSCEPRVTCQMVR